MKKVISLIFVFILCLSLVTPVLAGGNTGLIKNMYFLEPEGFKKMEVNKESVIYFDGHKDLYICVISGLKDTLGFKNNTKSVKEVEEANLKFFLENYLNEEKLSKEMKYVNEGKKITTKITSKSGKYKTNKMNVDMYVYEIKFTNKAQGYEDYKGYYKVILMVNEGKLYMVEYGKEESDKTNEENILKFEESILFEEKDYTNVIRILVNDEYVNPDSDPVIVNDRTLVPIRAVAEELKYSVTWNAEKRQVDIFNDKKSLQIVIDSNIMQKNTAAGSEKIEIDVAAQIISDRTYLPLRAVGEALGCFVDWDAENRTVIVNGQ